jgi:hypothetical protein
LKFIAKKVCLFLPALFISTKVGGPLVVDWQATFVGILQSLILLIPISSKLRIQVMASIVFSDKQLILIELG